ncbi:MAG: biotin/lipoyl-binding protein [Betaproteobacteria bacterium]|nr:biotin/lipoyl-binding protein [Betaproteobacteria bacterium]
MNRVACHPMNRKYRPLLIGLLILLIIIAVTVAAIWKRKDGKKPSNPLALELVAQQADQALRFAPMDWVTVKPMALASYIPLTGTVRAVDSATVKAKLAGELQSLSVREGMTVNKGDVLGQIDPTDYELRIQERQAQLRQAEAQWLTAQPAVLSQKTAAPIRSLRLMPPKRLAMRCSFNSSRPSRHLQTRDSLHPSAGWLQNATPCPAKNSHPITECCLS